MKELIDRINGTIENLDEKYCFLQDQYGQYIQIRQRLLDWEESEYDNETDDSVQHVVYGELILSNKLYVNIGQEYYVERSKEEAIGWVEEKLVLLEEAISHFTEKLREARKIKEGLEQAEGTSSRAEGDSREYEEFPFVEIREDIDENGNVIKSSVRPSKVEEVVDKCEINEGSSISGVDCSSPKTSEIVLKTDKVEEVNNGSDDSNRSETNPDAIHTFHGLVQKFESVDLKGNKEADYCKARYESQTCDKFNVEDEQDYHDYEYDGDEDEDQEDYNDCDYKYIPSLVPHTAMQNLFLTQINNLRAKKLPKTQQENELKSILKKSTKTSKKKPGHVVEFAPTLDIFEVENVKAKTKQNTFDINRTSQSNMIFDVEDLDSDGFDSDLFAQLIGAKDADDMHEKYGSNEGSVQPESITKTKKRISRFKKDRMNFHSNGMLESEVATLPEKNLNCPVVGDIIENTIIRNSEQTEVITNHTNGSNMTILHNLENEKPAVITMPIASSPGFSVMPNVVEKETCDMNTNATDITPYNDRINKLENKIIDKVQIVTGSILPGVSEVPENPPIVSKSAENAVNLSSQRTIKFKKTFNSLQKPRFKPKVSPTLNFDDLTDDSDNDQSPLEPVHSVDTSKVTEFTKLIPDALKHQTEPKIQLPKPPFVDFQKLNSNIDGMACAYTLGVYDDDIEDPGILLEKLDDINAYNKQAEDLKNEIKLFNDANVSAADYDSEMLTDIFERDNDDIDDSFQVESEDLALTQEKLNEEISLQYHITRRRMLDSISESISKADNIEEQLQLEPIDEYGNPIKTSRFKSNRVKGL